ncbi:SDR family NAD(P)-dependent oxidoreductase [Ollibium composti]|uniref:SDR family oxidoreductase n=1 Tax=Ollibium composti TaxID=2675109 RepID=A0ABY2Q3V9_9HYPH|nr:SDR family oxidoreductase [Mesorhizobium composti]THF55304.1 SDR family oxidoreductase [Mesorhizobium composti]
MLADRIAVVTGAGQGNGAAIAKGLAAAGAGVVAVDVNAEPASATAEAIRQAGGQAWWFQLDVTDEAGCHAVAGEVAREIGDASIVVNNAGICPRHTIDDPGLRAMWNAALDVNLTGTLNVSLAFLPQLRKTRGAIVNIASIASFLSTSTSVGYTASKAGVRMLTLNLAQELAKDGIRVNAIAPGAMATPMTEATRNDPARLKSFLGRIPLGRMGEPEELVGPAVFLASPMSSYVTGTVLVVDGGYMAL